MLSKYVFPSEPMSSSGSVVDPTDSYEYVIITTSALQEAFEEFKLFKLQQGVRTTIITVEDILACPAYEWDGEFGDGFPFFDDLQCKIRNFIKDAYMNWGIDYVLLGGDDNLIPHRGFYCYIPGAGFPVWDYDIPSDIYYSCLDGTFNKNRDDKWAQITDNPDLQAEVAVGRASVENAKEVSYFTTKTKTYAESLDSYLEKVLLVGEKLDSQTWGGDYIDQLIDSSDADGYTTVGIPSDEYTIDTLYDRDWSWPKNDWPVNEIISRINNNVHIINHLGHSNEFINMKMNVSQADALTNDQFCFIYSQGCSPGAFDEQDCIAEHFTVKTPHGAFAGIWNSRYGFFEPNGTDGPSHMLDREFFDAVFGESQQNYQYRTIGFAHENSKADNLWRLNITHWDSIRNVTWSQASRWSIYNSILFGDPQQEIRHAEVQEHDLAVIHIEVPKYSIPDEDFTVKAKIKNKGTSHETDVQTWVEVDGIPVPGEEEIIDILAPNDIAYLTFKPNASYAKHDVSVHVEVAPGEIKDEDNSLSDPVIADHPPEKPDTPWGPTSVKILKPYVYKTRTVDQNTFEDEDTDCIRFKWKWDNTEGPWTWLPYDSNQIASRIRVWTTKGSHAVQVKAVDKWGRESEWSEKLSVTVPHVNSFDIYIYACFVLDDIVSIQYDEAIMQQYEQQQMNHKI